MVYLDASAMVPLYTPETGSDTIERYVLAADVVAISDLSLAEAQNAIIRKGRRGLLAASDVAQAIDVMNEHVAAQRYVRIAIERCHFARVASLSRTAPVHLRTLDALHLAVVLGSNATAMATDDVDLATAARSVGLIVFCSTGSPIS